MSGQISRKHSAPSPFAAWTGTGGMICLAAGILILLYYQTLPSGFRGEEFQLLWLIQNKFSFYDSFVSQFLGEFQATNCFYRPIPREFCYFVVTSLFGPTPLAFRVILFALLLANVLLVYTLAHLFSTSRSIAFLAAVFFVTRYCHADLMYWILFGFERLLVALFILSAVLAYSVFLQTEKHRYFLISCACTLFALMTHEVAFVLPAYIVLVHVLHENPGFRRLAYCCLPFVCLTLLFVLRILLVGRTTSGAHLQHIVFANAFSPVVLVKNTLWSLYNCFNGPVECFILISVIFLVLAFRRFDKLTLFGLSWFIVSLLPFIAMNGLCGAYLMLPVFGISIIVAQSIQATLKRTSRANTAVLAIICCMFMLSAFKNLRSGDRAWQESLRKSDAAWQESEQYIANVLSYFSSCVSSLPGNALVCLRGQGLSGEKLWLLGEGMAFRVNFDAITVCFESEKHRGFEHREDIYYFDLSDTSITFPGR